MFGAKQRLLRYLKQVKPWADGIDGRGWYKSDFDSDEVREQRLSPTGAIYPLPAPQLAALDLMFISPEQYGAFVNFEHARSNFNAHLALIPSITDAGVKYKMITSLHAGCIGAVWSGGVHAAYYDLLVALEPKQYVERILAISPEESPLFSILKKEDEPKWIVDKLTK